ncbi:MAG: glycoside hydrolase family 3 C-terminal domain-containing protein [Spirochaetaceae bacterium]
MKISINNLLKELTLEEKASLCSGKDFWHLKGIERLNIPSIMVTDGPHGLRKQEAKGDHVGLGGSVKATCFPTASATASSWDIDMMEEMGVALGEECLAEDVSVLLGPGVNIKRSPLCGRNFEYISEDPYVTGKMGAALVNGIQSQGIGTSLKHFALNNQEHRRMVTDSVVDERTLREIYLPGFEEVIKKAGPWTVMCAYNKIEGEYCSDNKKLLTDILKDEWGHTGLVVTDWGACNDRVQGIKAGLELEMPSSGGINDKLIVEAVNSGNLTVQELDKVVSRVLDLIFKSEEAKKPDFNYDKDVHNELARKVAGNSAVLLKNSNNFLPLINTENILIVGEFAKTPRYQGAGSSFINPHKITSSLDEFDKLGIKYDYKQGYNISSDIPDNNLIIEAVNSSKGKGTVIIFAGLTDDYESEGFDRIHIDLPDSHTSLIKSLAEVNNNVIVVLQNGAPVSMPWKDSVNSILECYLGGQAGGAAAVDILLGKVNPSGKLAETFPIKIEDDLATNWFGMGPKTVEYRESIYVGYRYYDTAKKDVLFPFGYGLSYTEFEYSNLKLDKTEMTESETLTVSLNVKNTGSLAGKEIVQLYVNDTKSIIFRPEKELKEFTKVDLNPGEQKNVTFKLSKRDFAYYNVDEKDWVIESGNFKILLGASSRDIRLEAELTVNSSSEIKTPDLRNLTPEYYNIKDIKNIKDGSFTHLLGREIPMQNMAKGELFNITSTVGDVSNTFIGKKLYKLILKNFLKTSGNEEKIDPTMERMMTAIIFDMPLRSLILMSGGKFSTKAINGVIHMINSRYLKGIITLLKPGK